MPSPEAILLPPQDQERSRALLAGSITELVQQLEQDSHASVTEIPVWGVGVVDVRQGEVGAIHTKGLMSCHVSAITGHDADGRRTVGMTHFPPETSDIIRGRYKKSVRELSAAMEAQGVIADHVVTVVDRYVPDELAVIGECFPDAAVTAFPYNRKAPGRSELVDKGRVLAMVDYRDQAAPKLIVVSEMGTKMLPLTPA